MRLILSRLSCGISNFVIKLTCDPESNNALAGRYSPQLVLTRITAVANITRSGTLVVCMACVVVVGCGGGATASETGYWCSNVWWDRLHTRHRSALHLETVCPLRKQFMHKGTDLTNSNLCCTERVLKVGQAVK